MLDVSIIILNWNTKKLLLDCIESVKTQTKQCEYEIIVVDNASVDGSAEAVRSNHPEIKVIENEKNEGFARGNNIGIAQCKGIFATHSHEDQTHNQEGDIDHFAGCKGNIKCDHTAVICSLGLRVTAVGENTYQDEPVPRGIISSDFPCHDLGLTNF